MPIEDMDLDGPLLVIGQEVGLASGRIDLVGLARSGDLLLVEFKTGPQNPDFRHVLAQLVDYGSDLWGQSLDEFDNTVVRRYLTSQYCTDRLMRDARSLAHARHAIWPDMQESEIDQFQIRLGEVLTTGDFHFVAVAQRFTQSMANTVRYLNQSMKRGKFYLVEMIRYQSTPVETDGQVLSAYAGQMIARPESQKSDPAARTDESQFLDTIADANYRQALQRFFDACRVSGLTFSWGIRGASIRIATQDRAEPLSIAWIFPSDGNNWSGLSDLTLGYDSGSLATRPSVKDQIERYAEAALSLRPAATRAKAKPMVAATFSPSSVVGQQDELIALITNTVASINDRGNLA
ncbi:hypothetical protein [Kribbella kalugense]|uniref:hypothetical protein n=1 Tax=Kribbella kalugense TaxID=2512221 RepID=UPI001065952C|nr:hypothetical protein [Kribbella kalugense]